MRDTGDPLRGDYIPLPTDDRDWLAAVGNTAEN
jgi:hypothetical protein